MRGSTVFVVVVFAGCGSSGQGATDANPAGGDAAQGCQPTKLLTGGSDVVAQGWTVVMQAPAVLSNGSDHVALQTSTVTGAATGGQLLLTRAGAVEPGKPFKLQIEMLIERTDAHDPFDAATAILGSFDPPFGDQIQRSQMIYLDSDEIGWADGTDEATVATADGAYHTYELAVDADGNAQVSVDGAGRLTRVNFAVNGTIAIGDQTNDPRRDSALRIRSVAIPCP